MKPSKFALISLGTLIIALIFFAGCGNSSAPHESLNGTWKNNIMTATFDFDKGTYSGVALGQPFNNKLTLVSEDANVVVFKSGGNKVICQFQDDGGIMLTKEGGIPLVLARAK